MVRTIHACATALIGLTLVLSGAAAQAEPPAVGAPALQIDIEQFLQGPDDASSVSLESLKGNVVLLGFWATWCGPCVGAIAHLNELAEHFEDDDVRFISISDESAEKVEPFLKRKTMKSWVALDTDKSMFDGYEVRGIPHTVLIDREGNIAAYTYPTHVTKKTINDMLAGRDPDLNPSPTAERVTDPDDAGQPEPLLEVTIRPTDGASSRSYTSPHEVMFDGQPLQRVMSYAYEIDQPRILDEQGALPSDPLYVKVRLPEDDSEQLLPLLQQALEMTFDYTARFVERETDVWLLKDTGRRGAQMTEADGTGGSKASWSGGYLSVTNNTVAGFARILQESVDRPVIDETGLDGRYDMTLMWEVDDDHTAIRKALKEQLGLEFVADVRPVRLLVIEPIDTESDEKDERN